MDNWIDHVQPSIKKYNEVNETSKRMRGLTTGSGASFSLHITHGTPVPNPTAILAAQFTYARPAAPLLSGPYSFSIYKTQREVEEKQIKFKTFSSSSDSLVWPWFLSISSIMPYNERNCIPEREWLDHPEIETTSHSSSSGQFSAWNLALPPKNEKPPMSDRLSKTWDNKEKPCQWNCKSNLERLIIRSEAYARNILQPYRNSSTVHR